MIRGEPFIFPERPRVAVPCGAVLGEGPVWDGRTGRLLWVDIKGMALWRWVPGGEPERIPFEERCAFVRPTDEPETVLLGLKSGLALFTFPAGPLVKLLAPEPDRPGNRLNDADVGPDGTLYFGSMDDAEKAETGRFYRLGPDGPEPFGVEARVTNGPAIDPALRRLYTADTHNGRIFCHDLDEDGRPGVPVPFVVFGPNDGHPDGLTVDAESHLWVCHFGGARVTRFSPEGEAMLEIPMPTPRVTKAAFGGPDLTDLYVTTASIGLDRETDPLAGHVFVLEPGIKGLPAVPFPRPR